MNGPSDFSQTHEGANSFGIIPHQTNPGRWGIDDRKTTLHVRYGHLCLSTWASIIYTGVPYFQHPCLFFVSSGLSSATFPSFSRGRKFFQRKISVFSKLLCLESGKMWTSVNMCIVPEKKRVFKRVLFLCPRVPFVLLCFWLKPPILWKFKKKKFNASFYFVLFSVFIHCQCFWVEKHITISDLTDWLKNDSLVQWKLLTSLNRKRSQNPEVRNIWL